MPVSKSLRNILFDTEISDVILVGTDGNNVPALRGILAARSLYFHRLFYGHFSEAHRLPSATPKITPNSSDSNSNSTTNSDSRRHLMGAMNSTNEESEGATIDADADADADIVNTLKKNTTDSNNALEGSCGNVPNNSNKNDKNRVGATTSLTSLTSSKTKDTNSCEASGDNSKNSIVKVELGFAGRILQDVVEFCYTDEISGYGIGIKNKNKSDVQIEDGNNHNSNYANHDEDNTNNNNNDANHVDNDGPVEVIDLENDGEDDPDHQFSENDESDDDDHMPPRRIAHIRNGNDNQNHNDDDDDNDDDNGDDHGNNILNIYHQHHQHQQQQQQQRNPFIAQPENEQNHNPQGAGLQNHLNNNAHNPQNNLDFHQQQHQQHQFHHTMEDFATELRHVTSLSVAGHYLDIPELVSHVHKLVERVLESEDMEPYACVVFDTLQGTALENGELCLAALEIIRRDPYSALVGDSDHGFSSSGSHHVDTNNNNNVSGADRGILAENRSELGFGDASIRINNAINENGRIDNITDAQSHNEIGWNTIHGRGGVVELGSQALAKILSDVALCSDELFLFERLIRWVNLGRNTSHENSDQVGQESNYKEESYHLSYNDERALKRARINNESTGKNICAPQTMDDFSTSTSSNISTWPTITQDDRFTKAKQMAHSIELTRIYPSALADIVRPSKLVDPARLLSVHELQGIVMEHRDGSAGLEAFIEGCWRSEYAGGLSVEVRGAGLTDICGTYIFRKMHNHLPEFHLRKSRSTSKDREANLLTRGGDELGGNNDADEVVEAVLTMDISTRFLRQANEKDGRNLPVDGEINSTWCILRNNKLCYRRLELEDNSSDIITPQGRWVTLHTMENLEYGGVNPPPIIRTIRL